MNDEPTPTTLIVEMMTYGIEASARDAAEIVLNDEESFALGRAVDPATSRTYAAFVEAFPGIVDRIPRTLAVITPRGRFVHVFVDLGRYHDGQFDAFVDGERLTADRPNEGTAARSVDRHDTDGFVLELRHKTLRRTTRMTARFGVKGRITKTDPNEHLELLRHYIVPQIQKGGRSSEALAVAIDEHTRGHGRARGEVARRTVAAASTRFGMTEDQLKDAARYAYREVFVWIVGQPVRARRRPDHARWVRALAETGLDRVAEPLDEECIGTEFRERNTVEGLVDLAEALSDAGVLTREDLAPVLDELRR